MIRTLTRMLAVTALVAATFVSAGAGAATSTGSADGDVTPTAGCGDTKTATVTGWNGTIVRGSARWTVICTPGHTGASGWVSDRITDGYDICVTTGSGSRIARTHGGKSTEEFNWRAPDNDDQLNVFAHVC